MPTSDLISTAFTRCPTVQSRSLDDFLDTLLDEDLATLAQLPGTPGQVLAAQFTHYARSSVTLRECLSRDAAPSSHLIESVQRLPASRKRRSAGK